MTKQINIIFTILLVFVLFLSKEVCAATIVDNAGRNINVTKPFQRIISLYGAHTENLFYIGAENQIIGVSINDTFPEKIKTKKKFSYHDDAEKFLGADPDLIIIRPMIDKGYYKLFNTLEKLGIVVVSLQPSNTDEMYDYWLKLGILTGKNKKSENMVAEFNTQI